MKVHTGLSAAALPQIAAVLSDAFADYPVEISWTPDTLRQMGAADSVVLGASCLVSDESGRELGVCLAALRGDSGRIAAMGVVRDAHRQGVGRILGEAVLQSLASAGARTVVLEALTTNTPALALYAGPLGFSRQRRLIGFTREPGSEPVDQSQWDHALSEHSEPDSWQLAHVISIARTQPDLTYVPAVIPERHPIARLLERAGFAQAEIDQYELTRPLEDARPL